MKEELFVSGRNIPNIDPVLHIWHWHIPLYLFLGGLAAGIIFFAAFSYLRNKDYPGAIKLAPIIAPVAISIGLIALLLDLKHPLYFWRLFTSFRIESPMSWGAWVLSVSFGTSILWPLSFIKDIEAHFEKSKFAKAAIKPIVNLVDKVKILNWVYSMSVENRKALAYANAVLAVILGVYTGILLSAFNARPLWNTSLLGPLFLVSGLSTGAAAIMWITPSHKERTNISKIDLMLIAVELFFIIHLFMGFMASTAVQQEAALLFLGGEFTVIFWGGVVGLGLVFPAFLEIMELLGYKIPISIPAFFILLGGLIFRFIMVDAGQITRYLY